jgi:hypothetical protein
MGWMRMNLKPMGLYPIWNLDRITNGTKKEQLICLNIRIIQKSVYMDFAVLLL